MLGELINISKNYNNNELGKIIYDLYLMIKEDNDCEFLDNLQSENIDEEINLFMNSIIHETSDVVYGYRNKYSHTGVMTKEELFELKEILLKDGGLYYKIGLLKKQLNNLLC